MDNRHRAKWTPGTHPRPTRPPRSARPSRRRISAAPDTTALSAVLDVADWQDDPTPVLVLAGDRTIGLVTCVATISWWAGENDRTSAIITSNTWLSRDHPDADVVVVTRCAGIDGASPAAERILASRSASGLITVLWASPEHLDDWLRAAARAVGRDGVTCVDVGTDLAARP